jgi:hypothetical protein
MKANEKIVNYHLDSNRKKDKLFIEEIEKIKNSGKRLSDKEKQKLLRKAKSIIYK